MFLGHSGIRVGRVVVLDQKGPRDWEAEGLLSCGSPREEQGHTSNSGSIK